MGEGTTNQQLRQAMERQLGKTIARMRSVTLGLILGIVAGTAIFLMTAVLLVEGRARGLPPEEIGQTLALLGYFCFGYSVTWPGAFIGLAWGFAYGGIGGWAAGQLYNQIVGWRLPASRLT